MIYARLNFKNRVFLPVIRHLLILDDVVLYEYDEDMNPLTRMVLNFS